MSKLKKFKRKTMKNLKKCIKIFSNDLFNVLIFDLYQYQNIYLQTSKIKMSALQPQFKKTRKIVNGISDEIELFNRKEFELMQKKYGVLCRKIEGLLLLTNQTFSLVIGKDNPQLKFQGRDPQVLLDYYFGFISEVNKYLHKKQPVPQCQNSQDKKHKNKQSSIFETLAQRQLQNFDLRQKLDQVNVKLNLTLQRLEMSEQLTCSLHSQTNKILDNYRICFSEILRLLKTAETHQTELLQNMRFLTQEKKSLEIQFQRYKKNFKERANINDKQYKMKKLLESKYQNQLARNIKVIQYQIKNQKQKQN